MKKIIDIKSLNYFPQEKGDWCRYACTQMLLGFKGITCFDQTKFFEVHKHGRDNYDKNISHFIENLNLVVQGIIEYRRDLDLTSNDIKNYITGDNPVCVTLYLDSGDNCGHSYIVYGFDDSINMFYVIDPQNVSKKEMSYSDFDLCFNTNRQGNLGKEIFIVK
jgi:hypothetical protein